MKKFRAGLLIPWVNTAMEDEIPTLVNRNVGLHWSRLRPSRLPLDGHDDSYLQLLLDDIPNAITKFDGLDLQTLVLGCTSASVVNDGNDLVYPGKYQHIEKITAFDAAANYLKQKSAHDVILFGPYQEHILESEVKALNRLDVKIAKAVKINYDQEIRFISSIDLFKKFQAEYSPNYDAVFFSCTALYTLEVIRFIREMQNIQIPIISSNTAIALMLNNLYNQKYPSQIENAEDNLNA